MSNVIFNNFTSGLVTQKLGGNYGSSIYHNGCAELENFSVMLQGGITRRPPLVSEMTATGSRIIPFIIDVDEVYMVELGYASGASGFFKLWHKENDQWTAGLAYSGTTPYLSNDNIRKIQFAQSADVLYLAEEHYTPQKIYYDKTSHKWEMSDVNAQLTTYMDGQSVVVYDPMGDAGTLGLFKDPDNHPRVVGFLANRLWFASSPKYPNRYWASMPFDHEYFKFYTIVQVVDDAVTAASITASISTDTYSATATYAVGDQVTRFGLIYQCKTAITTPEEWNIEHWEYTGEMPIQSTVVYKNKETVTEDNAIRFDACGNDAIRWISAKNNMLIGTASGEYMIPGTVNGINYRIDDLSSYGSMQGAQAIQGNGEILFPQGGGRRVRSVVLSADGYSCLDLTYQCDRLLADHGGVVRMAWRRVPDPTLYTVLGDGTVAVLFYERGYGLCAWSHWTFKKSADESDEDLAFIEDVCVLDRPDGQDVYFLVQRGGSLSIESLKPLDAAESYNVSYLDLGTIPFVSHMKTNPYEFNSSAYGSSLGKKKRIRAINCRLYRSKAFVAGYGEKYMKNFSGAVSFKDVEVLLPGGYDDFVQMTVESAGADPLTVLAFSLDMEAER